MHRLACRSLIALSLPLTLAGCPGDDAAIDTVGDTVGDSESGSTSDSATTTTTDPGTSMGPDATTGSADSTGGSTTAATTEPGTSTGPVAEDDGTTGEISVCGNNVIEGNEVCDLNQLNGETCQSLGHQGGQLGCRLTCDDYNLLGCFICGNEVIDSQEDCEGSVPEEVDCVSLGYQAGEVTCGADCLYDTTECSICGDGVQQGPESCDGLDLNGETCESLGLVGGTLACNIPTCSFDATGCDIPGTPFGSDVGYTGYELTLGATTCDDISATGTATGLTDESSQQVPIGFTFPVYGVDQTMATIQSNGTLRWGDNTHLTYNNTCLPSSTSPSTNVLYVFWDDLNPNVGAGEVYYQTLGMPGDQRFVVQWDVANFAGDATDLMRFQVVLHESNGFIDVCYVDTINAANAANNGAEATSGIQSDSMNAVQYSCNTPDLVDGLQLLYIPI